MTTSRNLPHRIYGWSRHAESGGVDARAVSPVVSGVMLRPRQTERAKHLEQQGGLCASEVDSGGPSNTESAYYIHKGLFGLPKGLSR